MHKLRLRFRLEHWLKLAPRVETAPVFHAWVSGSLSRHYYACPAQREASEGGEHVGSQAFDLRFEIDERSGGAAHLHPLGVCHTHDALPLEEKIYSSSLNMDIFALIVNKKGERAKNQAGSVRLCIADLLRSFASDPAEHHVAVKIPSYGGVGQRVSGEYANDKGAFRLSPLGDGTPFLELDGRPLNPEPSIVESLSAAAAKVYSFQQDTFLRAMYAAVDLFKRIRPTWSAIADHNSYVFQSRAGAPPSAAYLGTPLGGTAAAYFDNALSIVLRRMGRDPETFRATDKDARAVLGRVLTLAANSFVYLPDEVYLPHVKGHGRLGAEPLESFDYCRVRLGGDCEDLALEIVLEAAELERTRAAPESPVGQMAAIAQRHVFAMVLGGVSSAEINSDYGQLKEMGAHMMAFAFSIRRFAQMWKLGNGLRYPDALRRLEQFGGPPSAADEYPMVLEGTGRLEPESDGSAAYEKDMRTEEALYDRFEALARRADLSSALSGLRRVYRFLRGKRNAFYQTCSILFVNSFLLRGIGPQIAFAICKVTPTGYTVGVEFGALTANAPDIALWSEPEFNEVELECMRDTIQNLHPLGPLLPPQGGPEEPYAATLEPVKRAAARNPRGNGPTRDLVYFIKPGVLTEAKRDELERLVASCPAFVRGFDYDVERVLDGLSVVRVRFAVACG